MTKDEALKIALDYVLRTTYWTEGRDRHDTLKAIKEALAQPERHELQAKGEHPAPCARFCEANAFRIVERGYQRQIRELQAKLAQPEKGLFIDLIAQHDGLAEELAQPEQEPVAWIYSITGALFDICPPDADDGEFLPLYTTPPKEQQSCDKRPWVGLTEDEMSEIAAQGHQRWKEHAQAIEAKLKEKNT